MNVTPITMHSNYSAKNTNFGAKNKVSVPVVTMDTPDDKIVSYGTCGPNYTFPIYAWQIKEQMAQKIAAKQAQHTPAHTAKETPEEYYQRKIYSPEWAG